MCGDYPTEVCFTAADVEPLGLPSPGACVPVGQDGCFDTDRQALRAPCCPGLHCCLAEPCGGAAGIGTCRDRCE